MNLSKMAEKYLNLIDYRVRAKITKDEREVRLIDKALDGVKKKLTKQDTDDLLLYLKQQAEQAEGS